MSHASVTCRCQHNDPACKSYCALGEASKYWSVWVRKCWNFEMCQWAPTRASTAANQTKAEVGAQHRPPLSRAKTEKGTEKIFFVHVQFSISLAMERDALQPHSIMTLFHRQKNRKLDFFLQSHFSFSQWGIELISRRLWTSTSTRKEKKRRREKCNQG